MGKTALRHKTVDLVRGCKLAAVEAERNVGELCLGSDGKGLDKGERLMSWIRFCDLGVGRGVYVEPRLYSRNLP
jgi:hypothetical protein